MTAMKVCVNTHQFCSYQTHVQTLQCSISGNPCTFSIEDMLSKLGSYPPSLPSGVGHTSFYTYSPLESHLSFSDQTRYAFNQKRPFPDLMYHIFLRGLPSSPFEYRWP